MMKRILFILLIPILFFSCNKEEPSLLTVIVPAIEFPILATYSEFETHFIPGNDGAFIRVNIAKQITDAGYELSDIREIVPRRADFSVNFNEERLDFLRAMSIRVCQEIGSNNSCAQEVFWRDPLSDNPGFSEVLNPSATGDIKDVLFTDDLFVQLILEELWFNPPGNFTVRLDMEFSVR